MRLLWEDRAWSDYLYWQEQDKKTRATAKKRLPFNFINISSYN